MHDVIVATKRMSVKIRAPRPMWRDPRFLGGIALVVIAIVATTWLVAQARNGTPTYVTTRPVARGEALTASNTTLVDMRIGSGTHLTEGELNEGAVALRSLGEGELLARSSVGTSDELEVRRIILTVTQALPESATTGDELELWRVPEERAGQSPEVPSRIGETVTLVSTLEPDPRGGHRIEVIVPATEISHILAATAGRDRLTAVPVGR